MKRLRHMTTPCMTAAAVLASACSLGPSTPTSSAISLKYQAQHDLDCYDEPMPGRDLDERVSVNIDAERGVAWAGCRGRSIHAEYAWSRREERWVIVNIR